ncbi:MAG: serine/threonine-protein kinase [Thermodesulfobacteriota bacterium]
MVTIKDLDLSHLVGRDVGTATLLSELGRGAMAVIFTAYQRTLKRQIAIKILPRSILTAAAADQFQQEAETAAILSHPNIIQIYEVGSTDEFIYFTMQLIQGRPLSYFIALAQKHVIPSKRFIDPHTTIRVFSAVLEGLEYAHTQDILHRDIKPANIMIEKHSKRPIIMDFGISKNIRESEESEQEVMGTPLNMAPEQILRENLDNRADIYAAGVMLFQMLAGELPLATHESTREMLKLKLKGQWLTRTPSQINPAVNEEMDRIVLKAMARDPGERYAACRDFSRDLRGYASRYLQAQR